MKMKVPLMFVLMFSVGCCLLLPAYNGYAQQNLTALTYSVSGLGGDAKDYINEVSWRGLGLEYRRFNFEETSSIGFYLGWNVWDKRTAGTFTVDYTTLTGTQRRYINSVPFLLTGHYYFGNTNSLQLYVGGGAGAYFIVQTFQIGVGQFEKETWHLGLAPEAGLLYPLSEVHVLLNLKYNYAFASGESIAGDPIDYQHWSVNVGIAFREW